MSLETADTMPATLLFFLLFICWTSAHNLASVMVTPSKSQHFEYEYFSVSCKSFGSGTWTVWRYTTDITSSLKLSQCGTDWGSQTSSTCNMTTSKRSDSGVYWCESEYRDSSYAVNITVTAELVILESPVLPVKSGENVTLRCKSSHPSSSNLPAYFYKDGSLIRTEPTGHMTIHHFTKAHKGAYKCKIDGLGESSLSWLLMKDDFPQVSLTVYPDSSQRLEYERVSLICGNNTEQGWIIKRSETVGGKMSICGEEWGQTISFGCDIHTSKQQDSAIYWCESLTRQRSNSVNITIHGGSVILQSPVLPVMEGHDVTLHCQSKTPPSNLPADFYKDGSLIRTEPAGHMTIQHVTKSDEGLYKCHISSHGESPPSWLSVRVNGSAVADLSVSELSVFRCIVVCSPYFISTLLLLSICRQTQGRIQRDAATVPDEDAEEMEPQYEDVIADVTTEHHF